MKKVVLVIIMLLILSATALAGDVPESVMLENNVEVIIGTVTSLDNKLAIIQVSKTFFEIVTEKTIQIEDFEYMTGSGQLGTIKLNTPNVGDYCAVALMPKDGKFIVYGGLCAKSDSLEATTLKLEGGNEFIERMNEYINTGHYSKEKRDKILSVEQPIDTEQSTATEVTPIPQKAISKTNQLLYGIIGVGLVIGALICLLVFRKRK